MFKRYTPDDFDKHGYLKPPKGFYLLLLVLLRPYIIWLLSVANRKEPAVLIESFYPDKSNFFLGLATAVGALLVFGLSSLRRKDAYAWLPVCWRYSRRFLWVTLLTDVIVTVYMVKNSHFVFQSEHAAVFLSLFFAGLYLFNSTRLLDFFRDWPEDAIKGYVADEGEDQTDADKNKS